MLLEGLHLPLTTPFYPDGRPYLRKLEHNVARYSRTPAGGLVALTNAGEPSLLSEAEADLVLEIIASHASPEKVLSAELSHDSVLATLGRIDRAAALRYDVALLAVPVILRQHGVDDGDVQQRVLTYFRSVADCSALPIVLLSDRLANESVLNAATVGLLAQHPQIRGLLARSPDISYLRDVISATASVQHEVTVTTIFTAATARMLARNEAPTPGNYIAAEALGGSGAALAVAPPAAAIRTRTRKVGFQVLHGLTGGLLEALDAGASGAITPFSACAPQACYEIWAAWKDRDVPVAREKQARLAGVAQRLERPLDVAGLKFAADLSGYFGGTPRLPLLPTSGAEREEIAGLMRHLRG